jgi:hypothetical protein
MPNDAPKAATAIEIDSTARAPSAYRPCALAGASAKMEPASMMMEVFR